MHLLRGTEQKRPEVLRERASEPRSSEPIGPCPPRLDRKFAEAWNYLVDCCPPGMLTAIDRAALSVAAILLTRMWDHPDELEAKDFTALGTALSKLGMTPTDRSKVQVPKDAVQQNPFSAMLRAPSGTKTAS